MDTTTVQGYLDLVTRMQEPEYKAIKDLIEIHLSKGLPPTEDKEVIIKSSFIFGVPSDETISKIRDDYMSMGWADLRFWAMKDKSFVLKLILP